MKKIALILLTALLVCTLCACSDDTTTSPSNIDLSDPTLTISECIEVPYQYDLTPYIDISREDYFGIEIEKTSLDVTDEDVNNAIYEDLAENATFADVTDRGAELGDKLNINFKGSVDGIVFDGGTAENYELILGQAGFIEGFEEALVGHSVGEEFTIDVTFPEDYGKDELNGKAAKFDIKMNSIKEEILPELTIDYVKEHFECDTIEAYLAKVQEELITMKAVEAENLKKDAAFSAVYDSVEIKDYPEKEYEYYYNDFVSYYEDIAKNYYNMDLEKFITEQSGSTEEEFYSYANLNAETIVKQELIFFAIANAEKLWQNLTKGDYDAYLAELAVEYDMTPAAFEQNYGSTEIWKSLIWDKTIDFIVDNAVLVDPVEETEDDAIVVLPEVSEAE